ncbi:hypothetical protein [Aeromonas hydrophila]|uniref:hypothetical protein n=1 Tax=Aeromonas hydrophila TaxID=644 RepID=UPI002B489640|nr:hypothetical protein [Aeromonas hydrophila]
MVARGWFIIVVVLVLLFSPIAFYVNTFGGELTQDHSRWAEFGSAMGGIYSPIVALFTLAVLVVQFDIQRKMHGHEIEQSYLQHARPDIDFYISKIEKVLSLSLDGNSILRSVIRDSFIFDNITVLDSSSLKSLAFEVNKQAPDLFNIWNAIYPIFMGLSKQNTPMCNAMLSSAQRKLIVVLGFDVCVALDNYHKIISDNELKFNYVFNRN